MMSLRTYRRRSLEIAALGLAGCLLTPAMLQAQDSTPSNPPAAEQSEPSMDGSSDSQAGEENGEMSSDTEAGDAEQDAGATLAEPPEAGQPLSTLVELLERAPGYIYAQSISWDAERQQWRANYRDVSGLDKGVFIDPVTGQITDTDNEPSSTGEAGSGDDAAASTSDVQELEGVDPDVVPAE